MGRTPMPRLPAVAGGTGVPPVGLSDRSKADLRPAVSAKLRLSDGAGEVERADHAHRKTDPGFLASTHRRFRLNRSGAITSPMSL